MANMTMAADMTMVMDTRVVVAAVAEVHEVAVVHEAAVADNYKNRLLLDLGLDNNAHGKTAFLARNNSSSQLRIILSQLLSRLHK